MTIPHQHLADVCAWVYTDDLIMPHFPERDPTFIKAGNARAVLSLSPDTHDDVLIVFTGTNQPLDWLDNLRFRHEAEGLGHVHRGFMSHTESLFDRVRGWINDNAPKARITLTGHSLGGACAVLTAWLLSTAGRFEGTLVQVVTFGAPRVGDGQFALAYRSHGCDAVTTQYQHAGDLVPRVPPRCFGYTHVGRQLVWSGAWRERQWGDEPDAVAKNEHEDTVKLRLRTAVRYHSMQSYRELL